jgi:4-aminobutyrate aminotransferase/diaminobutyrate-pyruvate transaminase/4-aminobutyrate aminotransferase/(S)-3-amino-2-methylpropionate transaminase
MRDWATENQALMIFDEVQSGFGRTGRFFAYEHFGVEADLVCCGKGISSSLPLSAVVGRRELIDVDPSLNSTHGGNPICCAAALANLMILERDKLVQSAARTGKVLGECLSAIGVRHPDYVDCLHGRGLIWALHIIDPIKRELDMRLADLIIERAMQKGVLLMRGAVGTIKIAPPLCIPEDAVVEGALAIGEAIDEVINEISR